MARKKKEEQTAEGQSSAAPQEAKAEEKPAEKAAEPEKEQPKNEPKAVIMSSSLPADLLEEEVEESEMESEAPKEKETFSAELLEKVRLFNKWSFKDISVNDESLVNFINLRPIIIPHTSGKHSKKKFWKSEKISIVERFVNKMLAPGLISKRIKGRGASHYMGKKQKALQILYNAFVIIEAKTGKNPIQALVDSIINVAPREEITRISMGGISYQQAVDISPQRRVDLAIKFIIQSTLGLAYNGLKPIDELIADELILSSRNDVNSKAIKRRDELERIAYLAR
jgi:small subunit ribosomal protein S7